MHRHFKLQLSQLTALSYSPLLLLQSKNGVFWMSWQDFQIHFRSIYVCRVYPPEMRYSVHGQWRGYSAGGCQDYDSWHQNPQYRLRVTGRDALYPVHVFITLTQVCATRHVNIRLGRKHFDADRNTNFCLSGCWFL